MPSGSHIFAIAFYRDREEKPTTYFLSGDLERHHLFQSDLYFSKFQNIFVPISELSKSFPTCSAILLHGDDDERRREVNNLFPNLGHHLFQPDLNQWERRAIDQSQAEVSAPSYCYISSSLGVLSLLRWNPIPSPAIGDHCAILCLNQL